MIQIRPRSNPSAVRQFTGSIMNLLPTLTMDLQGEHSVIYPTCLNTVQSNSVPIHLPKSTRLKTGLNTSTRLTSFHLSSGTTDQLPPLQDQRTRQKPQSLIDRSHHLEYEEDQLECVANQANHFDTGTSVLPSIEMLRAENVGLLLDEGANPNGKPGPSRLIRLATSDDFASMAWPGVQILFDGAWMT